MKLDIYQFAIFDFDGCVLCSNQAKSQAYEIALAEEPRELLDELMAYHREHSSVSRYVKAEHYFRSIKGSKTWMKDTREFLPRYAEIASRLTLDSPEMPGVRDVLAYFHSHNIACFVLTGSDQSEMRDILARLDLVHFFKGAYGSPRTKLENYQYINDVFEKRVAGVFFGDGREDYGVSRKIGTDFVFVESDSMWEDGARVCRDREVPVIQTFLDLAGS